MGYLVYFNVFKAKVIVKSPYNQRQNAFADRIIRGDILDSNGYVLAETIVDEDGNETRRYPYGSDFAHAIGIGHTSVPKSGIESAENFSLLTSDTFFVNKIINDMNGTKNMGDTVVTTLDADLQEVAINALGRNKGAVVVMEPKTGKILSMVSAPTFDPNSAAANWDSLNGDNENSPLLNRATQGLYAPGSVFKVVTALEFMREQPTFSDYTYDCNGEISYEETTISCYNHHVHGHQDLRSSMANSCNASFANIGLSLNKTGYRETAEKLLFNKKLPGPLESSKSRFVVDESTGSSEIMMTAIGQGDTMVSPYHMALITSAIANDGVLMTPYVVDKITNHRGSEISKNVPKSYKKLMTKEEADYLQTYMEAVVSEGTATYLSGQSYSVAGKTGTAEYSIDDKSKSHSWFIGFSNVDNPDIALCVVIEGSDGDSEAKAVPIARAIFDYYYSK